MSIEVDIVTKAKDLPEILEWAAKILREYPTQRFILKMSLKVEPKKDC